MENKFSKSINIIRDTESNFEYIPTPNSTMVVNQIVNDYKKGVRSFNIIGTYGTGKSAFLLALEQSLLGKKDYFKANFNSDSNFDFLKIIGSSNSIINTFSDFLDIKKSDNKQEEVLSELFNRYHNFKKPNKILFILVDEFGKFLEYASKNDPDKELYFIQQLAEFCNNPKHNIVLITTVHQSIDSYSYSLNKNQQQEWKKVKGRYREITFNEPVEQLLFLASSHISKKFKKTISEESLKRSIKLTYGTKAFSVNKDFVSNIGSKLFPLDLLSACTLTLSLQRYGQNERSLFSFLESSDHTGLDSYNKSENPFYNLSCVYDYLIFNFYSYITSKYNPDFSSWTAIRSSIEEIERVIDVDLEDYIKTVKVIGLLNIYAAKGSILDLDFLSEYLETSCGINNSIKIINDLESRKIIRYRNHANKYILFEGTDLDIQTAIIEAGNKISEVSDITSLLSKHIQFDSVVAKQYYFKTGTPRRFDFIISDYPIHDTPEGQTDGYINLLFNDKLKNTLVQSESKKETEAIIYCYFKKSEEIKNLLFEIEKIQKVIDENKEDRVAKRELENIVESQNRLLNHYINESIYSGSKDINWFFAGENKTVNNKKDFNKLLSQVSYEVYSSTPIFINELVNKHKISSSIASAKNKYFKSLIYKWDKKDLDFDDGTFPPEKTIYLSLLKNNDINPSETISSKGVTVSKDSSFFKLWDASESFLNKAKKEEVKVSLFKEMLSSKPFKLKNGLIDFWIPTFLFLKREDYALFNQSGYIPNISEENLELIAKNPSKYYIKTFDIEGVKLDIFNSYRSFLEISSEKKFTNKSFIETIKPFIVFYNQLPEYAQQTRRLSNEAIKIREVITNSKDPEKTFFEGFPSALSISISSLKEDKKQLQLFTIKLQDAVRELRTSYDNLIQRFEEFICNEFMGETLEFNLYKKKLQTRFSSLKKHMLLSNQKTFVQRIDSQLDDKKSWLNSIAQATVGRTLESFNDEDEVMLYDKFKSLIIELDSLTNLSNLNVDESQEEVIGIKIDSFINKIDPKIVRLPKNKSKEVDKIKGKLLNNLGSDKTANLAAVVNLLKDLLK